MRLYEFVKEDRGYSTDFPVSQDYDCWLRFKKEGRVGIVEKVLLDYRWGRISSNHSIEQIKYFWIANQIEEQRSLGRGYDIDKIKQRLQKGYFWYGRKFRGQTIAQFGMRLWQQGKQGAAFKSYLESLVVFPFDVSVWIYLISVCIFREYPSKLIQFIRPRTLLTRLMFVSSSLPERAIFIPEGHKAEVQHFKLCVIIPTLNRSHFLNRILSSLDEQQVPVVQTIIIDAGNIPAQEIVEKFPLLNIEYMHTSKASLTFQRNIAIAKIRKDVDAVCF